MRKTGTIRGMRNIGGVKGELDSEIGRRIEKGQRTDPGKAKKYVADKKDKKEWGVDVEEMERKDRREREKGIRKLKQFLSEVAKEEKERERQMRKRVEEITEEKLKEGKSGKSGESGDQPPGVLREPGTKKRGSFLEKVRKKGKGGMAEARGAIAKGGG